ncbi:kinesin light chain, putative [Ricinus communis]|uniref:Kinesin light chain, putative n=1 Tax=Ricinus communis TaxID=3988 RepID=B9SBF0_RICCO|nr:kinesin light chain, putative [Ricinus communis]
MPALVSVKTPSKTTPLHSSLPQNDDQIYKNDIKTPSPLLKRTPSPSSSKKTPNKLPVDENPDLGPFFLKLARDTIASGDNPNKALDYASRASVSFERCSGSGLELTMSLHVLAATYCSLGRFEEAVPVLERSIEVSDLSHGLDNALMKFSGYMQLGDTYCMLGQLDRSISCYESGLKIQIEALGDLDPRVAETYRYLAEVYVQAMQFDEAEKLCKKILEIHRKHSAPDSLVEAADRRLMALVNEAKGDYESALEHLVLASMVMIAGGLDNEVAAIDVCIGNIYVSVCRFDEAIFAYQKALTVFKSTKGDAIEIMEYILKVREEKLGTANPDVDDEKKRLAELLKEAGRARIKKGKSLENLLDSNSERIKKVTKRKSGFGFRT